MKDVRKSRVEVEKEYTEVFHGNLFFFSSNFKSFANKVELNHLEIIKNNKNDESIL